MSYQKTKKRLFEIIQASTEHDLASKVFDICFFVNLDNFLLFFDPPSSALYPFLLHWLF